MERREWLVPLTGILFIVLCAAGFAIGGEPKAADEGAEAVVGFYADNKDSVQLGAALVTLGAGFFVFFAGHLRKVLRRAEGEGHAGSLLVFGGALILATGLAIDSTLMFAASDAADENVDPLAVLALQALWDNDFMPMALGTFVFLLSLGASIVRWGALPKWIGWVALALGAISITPIGFAAFLGAGVLIVIISIMLALRARSEGAPVS